MREHTNEYRAIHWWLRDKYGKANHCEGENCNGKSLKFEYALKNGCEHSRDINNYIQLCKSCHSKYDNLGKKHSEFMKGKIPWNKGIKGAQKWSDYQREIMTGKIPWNKGLTKENNPSMLVISEKMKGNQNGVKKDG